MFSPIFSVSSLNVVSFYAIARMDCEMRQISSAHSRSSRLFTMPHRIPLAVSFIFFISWSKYKLNSSGDKTHPCFTCFLCWCLALSLCSLLRGTSLLPDWWSLQGLLYFAGFSTLLSDEACRILFQSRRGIVLKVFGILAIVLLWGVILMWSIVDGCGLKPACSLRRVGYIEQCNAAPVFT